MEIKQTLNDDDDDNDDDIQLLDPCRRLMKEENINLNK